MSNPSAAKVRNLEREIDEIRQERRDSRRKVIAPSKLDPYRDDIIILSNRGASLGVITEWLARRNVTVAKSTVGRALNRWIPRRQSIRRSRTKAATVGNACHE